MGCLINMQKPNFAVKICSLTNILIPHSNYKCLLIQAIRRCLEGKLCVKNRIKITPFHSSFEFFSTRVRSELTENTLNTLD